MTLEHRKFRVYDIEARQKELLAQIIAISKKLEKKSVKSAIDSAIGMVAIGLEIRMLEAEKYLIAAAHIPKYPHGTNEASSAKFVELRDGKVYKMTPKPTSG